MEYIQHEVQPGVENAACRYMLNSSTRGNPSTVRKKLERLHVDLKLVSLSLCQRQKVLDAIPDMSVLTSAF